MPACSRPRPDTVSVPAVAAQLHVAQGPVAVGRQRGVAGEGDGGDQPGRHVRRTEIVDLPRQRALRAPLSIPAVTWTCALPESARPAIAEQRLEARQIDGRADLALVVGRHVVAVALDPCERQGDLERLHGDLAAA